VVALAVRAVAVASVDRAVVLAVRGAVASADLVDSMDPVVVLLLPEVAAPALAVAAKSLKARGGADLTGLPAVDVVAAVRKALVRLTMAPDVAATRVEISINSAVPVREDVHPAVRESVRTKRLMAGLTTVRAMQDRVRPVSMRIPSRGTA
jgi:hypothetical protein